MNSAPPSMIKGNSCSVFTTTEQTTMTVPVHYYISRSETSPKMCMTLLLPWGRGNFLQQSVHQSNLGSGLGDKGKQEKIVRDQQVLSIPLHSMSTSSPIIIGGGPDDDEDQNPPPYWLDCHTIRQRLLWGGKALEFTFEEVTLMLNVISYSAVQLVELNLYNCIEQYISSIHGHIVLDSDKATFTAKIEIFNEPVQEIRGGAILHHRGGVCNELQFGPSTNIPQLKNRNELASLEHLLLSIGYSNEQCIRAIKAVSFPEDLSLALSPLAKDTLLSSGYNVTPKTQHNDDYTHVSSWRSGGEEIATPRNLCSNFSTDESALKRYRTEDKENVDPDIVYESDDEFSGNSISTHSSLAKNPSVIEDNIEWQRKENATSVWKDSGKIIEALGKSPCKTSVTKKVLTMTKIIVPEETKGFIFVCDAITRQECLKKCIFGAPAAAQYGPHNKLREGDILFLADFYEKTITGVFEASSDPGMNLDRTAFNGKYPWQVRIKPSTRSVRKMTLEKAFKTMSLHYGAKLNALTRGQLLSLLLSKEFAPIVPSKFKHSASVFPTEVNLPRPVTPSSPSLAEAKGNRVDDTPFEIFKKQSTLNVFQGFDEHPLTAILRLKRLRSWLHEIVQRIKDLNQQHSTIWKSLSNNSIYDGAEYIYQQWILNTYMLVDSFDSDNKPIVEDPIIDVSKLRSQKLRVKKLLLTSSGKHSLAVPNEKIANIILDIMIDGLAKVSREIGIYQVRLIGKQSREEFHKSMEDEKIIAVKVPSDANQLKLELRGKLPGSQKFNIFTKNISSKSLESLCERYIQAQEQYDGGDVEKKLILSRVFVLLSRYELFGLKMHSSSELPSLSSPINAIKKEFDISHECFTSPLFALCPKFYSPFSDSDRHFGSLGRFQDFQPIEGSHFYNCTALDISMNNAHMVLDHVLLSLNESSKTDEKPLGFVLVIPECKEIMERIKVCPYLRHVEPLATGRKKPSHFSKNQKRKQWVLNTPAYIMWLQNDFGYDIWTPTKVKVLKALDAIFLSV